MMLEAASIDLGTVWISYFDEEKARERLHLPDNWQPVGMLYIGYPAEDFVPNKHLGASFAAQTKGRTVMTADNRNRMMSGFVLHCQGSRGRRACGKILGNIFSLRQSPLF